MDAGATMGTYRPIPRRPICANRGAKTPPTMEGTKMTTATPPATPPTAPTTPPATPAPAPAEKKDPRYIAIVMTPDLLTAIRAKAGTTPHGTFLRNIVAKELGVTITTTSAPRVKYATPELKKAAQKERAKTQKELVKQLLAKHKAEIAAAAKA